jgi:plasmid stabilization system protein ParE
MRVEYHPSIERELWDIITYYNKCSQGLGTEFLNEFEHHILKIAAAPTRWMIIKDDIRRALMRRFPYIIYFRVLENDVLRVTVIKHQRRHPGYGQSRL